MAYRCAFCGVVVTLRDAAKIGGDYRVLGADQRGLGPVVIAAIDVSASMDYGSLTAVQASLLGTLADLAQNAPSTAFGLVAFATGVSIFGDAGVVAAELDEHASLADEEAIRRWTAACGVRPAPVARSLDGHRRGIAALAAEGRTALGPGLIVASELAAGGAGRVVLLTDGCANHGVGSLDGPSTQGRGFYAALAEKLQSRSVVVDVVGVAGEGHLELKTLSALPDITGGELYYVDKSEVSEAFHALRDVRYVAHNARVKLVVPPGVRVRSISGVSPGVEPRAGEELPLGGVAQGREMFVELEPEPGVHLPSRIVVQVELRYRDDAWGQRVEVRQVVLEPRAVPEAGADYDPGPVTMMEVQKAGEQALLKAFDAARDRLVSVREKLQKLGPSDRSEAWLTRIRNELQIVERELAKNGRAGNADASSAASYAMSKRRSVHVSMKDAPLRPRSLDDK
jgi:Mg-chelatase subunit ChlD